MAGYIVRADGTLLIISGEGAKPAGLGDKALHQFEELSDLIRQVSDNLLSDMKGIAEGVSEVSLTFGVGVEGETGIPFVAKGKADLSVEVQLKWERPKPAPGSPTA